MRLGNPEAWRVIATARRRILVCEADGLLVALHPRCQRCGVLLGPGHAHPAAADGLCGSCR